MEMWQSLSVDWALEYMRLRDAWRQSPVLYAKQRLGFNPTWQQAHLLNAIARPGARVSVRSGHSTGKSAAMSAAIWWKLECFDFSKIVCTAPSSVQLRDVLWSEISKWHRNSAVEAQRAGMPSEYWLTSLFEATQDKIVARGAPREWFAVARTSRPETPDALQGFHASDIRVSDDGYSIVENFDDDGSRGQILFVVDEAAGVLDKVFEVAEGALASPNSSLLMCGNPTRGTGYFANSHKHNRGDYETLHFRSSDSPLVDPGYRDGLVRKFGEDSNVVRVRADGEFPRADDDTLIPLDLVEAAIMRERNPEDGQRRLGIDVARFGDDRTVFVLRAGPNVEHVRIEGKRDTMEVVGIAVKLIKQWRVQTVCIDTIGIGSGVYDRLTEIKKRKEVDNNGDPLVPPFVQLVAVNVAERAPIRAVQVLDTEQQPYRLRDYLWLEMARWLRDDEPSFAGLRSEVAQDLAGELTSVRFSIDSTGRTVIEAKDAMKKRGLRSCDLADALGATFFTTGVMGPGAAIYEIMRRKYEEQQLSPLRS